MLPIQNEAYELWNRMLEVLPHMLDKGTYQHLRLVNSYGIKLGDGKLTVCVNSELTKQAINSRLLPQFNKLLCDLLKEQMELDFITEDEYQEPFKPIEQPTEPSADEWSQANLVKIAKSFKKADPIAVEALPPKMEPSAPLPPPDTDEQTPPPAELFKGFTGLESNFTLTPDIFFEVVLKQAMGGVVKLVGATIHQTIGQFEDKRGNRRREEWPVNDTHAMEISGIGSRPTYRISLWDALSHGYLVQRFLDEGGHEQAAFSKKLGFQVRYTLRIRYEGEPICYPDWPRPEYEKRGK